MKSAFSGSVVFVCLSLAGCLQTLPVKDQNQLTTVVREAVLGDVSGILSRQAPDLPKASIQTVLIQQLPEMTGKSGFMVEKGWCYSNGEVTESTSNKNIHVSIWFYPVCPKEAPITKDLRHYMVMVVTTPKESKTVNSRELWTFARENNRWIWKKPIKNCTDATKL